MKTGEKVYLEKNLKEGSYPLLLSWFRDIEAVSYLYAAERMIDFKTVDDVKNFLAEDMDEIFWEIHDSNTDKFIGYTSFCSFNGKDQCEFNIFILDKNYWGRGIGKEVTQIMLDHAFGELQMKRVVLETGELNKNARKLYEKMGFRVSEIIADDRISYHDGKWIKNGSVMMYLDTPVNPRNYKNRKYEVTAYDLIWKDCFEKEAGVLRSIFNETAIAIEHIGSTSIPGLAGKPTIDILILVDDVDDVAERKSLMEEAGFMYLGEYVKKGALLYAREENNARLCNVHIYQKDDIDIVGMRKFLSFLKNNPNIVSEYSKLKLDLFAKYPDDYGMYRKFKDEWLDNLIKRI
ncbi:MAG: GNAT family N-acetyltransferase [Candidatus Moraniibacteriota bacterium]